MKTKIILPVIATSAALFAGCASNNARYVETGGRENIVNVGRINIQDSIQAANDGISSITKLVDSAKATANQAQQLSEKVEDQPATAAAAAVATGTQTSLTGASAASAAGFADTNTITITGGGFSNVSITFTGTGSSCGQFTVTVYPYGAGSATGTPYPNPNGISSGGSSYTAIYDKNDKNSPTWVNGPLFVEVTSTSGALGGTTSAVVPIG